MLDQRAGTAGILIAVAGPSGSGKDSLISAARARYQQDSGVVFVRRVITRPEDLNEAHQPATEQAFAAMVADGAFALHWFANGLGYGLPVALVDDLARGAIVVANVSREATAGMRARFPQSLIVHVTASAETLAWRLRARGRETAEDQAARLQRALERDRSFQSDIRIENNGTLDEAVERFVAVIEAERAKRGMAR